MTTAATSPACIGEPLSWLRLEQYALARRDTGVAEHVAACPACRACLDEIERDVVALPPLAIGAKAQPKRRWWVFAIPSGLALAAAVILLLVLRPRDPGQTPDLESHRTNIKGIGTIELGVVRERAGVVSEDLRVFAPGDRWKLVVTCVADKTAWIDAVIVEKGAATADHPLEPVRVVCGNRIALPGAFTLTGDKPHLVCVRVATDAAPPREMPRLGAPGVACITLTPE